MTFKMRSFTKAYASSLLTISLVLLPHPLSARPSLPQFQQEDPLAKDFHDGQEELVQYLNAKGKAPEEYVTDAFRSHQIVLLGEIHEVRETCEFVASLIAPLDRMDVKRLCFEFLPSRFNDRLSEIVTATEYDEESVVQLFRESAWPTWGYREYTDIVRAVWQVNRNHSQDETPFLIVGMDSDWKQAELLGADAQTRFKTVLDRENHMTEVIRHTAAGGTKVLVHVGFAHTVRQGMRVAKQLDDAYGDQLFQIVMHHRLTNSKAEAPMTDAIETAIHASRFERVGFTVSSSPFSELKDPQLPYARALGGDASLAALAEGIIFLKPVDQLHKVTWIDGFITKETFDAAREIARKSHWIEKDEDAKTPAELDQILQKRFQNGQ